MDQTTAARAEAHTPLKYGNNVHGDKAYSKADDKLRWELTGGRHLVNKRGKRTARGEASNQTRSLFRAVVEHPFQAIKRQRGLTTVRYCLLRETTARVFALCALANL